MDSNYVGQRNPKKLGNGKENKWKEWIQSRNEMHVHHESRVGTQKTQPKSLRGFLAYANCTFIVTYSQSVSTTLKLTSFTI